jgi:glycosyltransferase involved in cell wall biosynthesis
MSTLDTQYQNYLKENLTIVIPCKNEGVGLATTLIKILAYHDCNVIVADSSDDGTPTYLNTINYLTNNYVKVVEGGLPAIARNNGFKEVNTPYVLFLDADMDISKLPLEDMLKTIIDKDIKLATCDITTWKWKYALIYKFFYYIQRLISFKTPFAVGGFMLFNSEYFEKLGKFNEDDKFAEDYHISMKVSPKHFKIFNYKIHTSDRRLKNKGLWYMVKLMTKCWFNKHNDEFYKQDYNYWK